MKAQWKLSALAAAGCLALLIGGCTRDPAVLKQRHFEKAQTYYSQGQYNEAIIELKNALQIDPKFSAAAHLIGRAYAAKAWHLDAVQELRRAVELEPDNLEAHIDLGRAYVAIEAWEDALREALTIASKDPANGSALYFRAAALNARGQRQDALALMEKALAALQSSPELHTLHGGILNGLERFVEAESAYRAALAQNPKHAAALIGLGDVLTRQNRPDEARRLLDQAKADNPTDASVRLALSAVHAAAGTWRRPQGARVAAAPELDPARGPHGRSAQRPDGTIPRGDGDADRPEADATEPSSRPVLARTCASRTQSAR